MADDIKTLSKDVSDFLSSVSEIKPPTESGDNLGDLQSAAAKAASSIDDAVDAQANVTNFVSAPPGCGADQFQGVRFYDGTSFGYLRVFADKVQLVVDKIFEFPIIGTVDHTYRIVGHGRDIKLYIDNELAIDASGHFTQPTSAKILEFGDIAGRNQNMISNWDSFRYTTANAFPPNNTEDLILEEIIAFPGGAANRMKEYDEGLYVSVDPYDNEESSSVYRYDDGKPTEHRSTLAITRSGINAVVIDPNRETNIFGTTGKYLATNSGLQYVLGSKPFPFDFVTNFSFDPQDSGWHLEENCEGSAGSLTDDVLTIDTLSEVGTRYFKYAQEFSGDSWVDNASNETGWTVEARVKIFNDGSGGINARTSNLAGAENISVCGQDPNFDDSVIPDDDGLNSPGVLINDGKYQEIVQFFQQGIRLKYARIFANQDLTDQFYTVRILGKGHSVAIYIKGDNEQAFRRVVFAPDALTVRARPPANQEKLHLVVDNAGIIHAVWQQASLENIGIYYSRMSGQVIAKGSGMMGSSQYDPNNTIIPARLGFGLPEASQSINYSSLGKSVLICPGGAFVSQNVREGDLLQVFEKDKPPRKFVIKGVLDETILDLATSDDLSGIEPCEWNVLTGQNAWSPPIRVDSNSFDSSNPRMLIHSKGDIFVAYDNNENGNTEIYLRKGKATSQGISFKDVTRITNSSREARNPDIAELANGDILLVWEDESEDRTISNIRHAVVKSEGIAGDIQASNLTTVALKAHNPRIGVTTSGTTSDITIVYEDERYIGIMSICAITGTHSTIGQSFNPEIIISVSLGNSINPAICGRYAVWEDHSYRKPEIILGTKTGTTWTQTRLTNSSGTSRNPVVACFNNIPYVFFESDRTHEGFFDLYMARGSNAGTMNSSGVDGIDTKIVTYVTTCHRPSVSVAPGGTMALGWEGYVNGGKTTIFGTVYDAASISSDETIIGYFPLNDNAGDKVVKNRLLQMTSLTDIADPLPKDGSAFNTTNVYSKPSAKTGISLFDPDSETAFDLTDPSFGFDISTTDYVKTAGTIDLYLTPHYDSSDLNPHVFLGNADLNTTTANTMSFGLGPEMTGNALKFRIVDGDGIVHETSVAGNPLDLWDQDESVHFRVSWDNTAIGASTINGISFVDATTGYACSSSGTIFKTTDGGDTWAKISSPTSYELYSIDFVDSSNGFACGEFGIIVVTTDGGSNWTLIETGFETIDLKSIFFRTPSIGYACGTSGTLIYSTDGGLTWAESDSNAYLDFKSISVFKSGSGTAVLAAGDGGQIYRSTDDGLTYSLVTPIPMATHWNALSRAHSASNHTGYIVGNSAIAMRSTDSGATWTNITTTWPGFFRPKLLSVSHAPTSSTVYATGAEGKLAYSTDSGASWNFIETSLENGSYKAIEAYFGGAGTGSNFVAAGVSGTLLYSNDQGITNVYRTIKVGALTISMNGTELDQTRTNDAPFKWDPSGKRLVFGNYVQGGASCANALFDDIVIFNSPIPNASAFERHELRSFQLDVAPVVLDQSGKRIEWGSISSLTKTKSQWKSFKMFFCGAKEPFQVFALNTVTKLVDDMVLCMALDKRGQLWLGTPNGISSVDTILFGQEIQAWLDGIRVPDFETDVITNYTNVANDLISGDVTTIAADDDDNIWAGTENGLMVMFRADAAADSTNQSDKTDPASQDNSLGGGSVLNAPQASVRFRPVSQSPLDGRILVVRSLAGSIFTGTEDGLAVITKNESKPEAAAQDTSSSDKTVEESTTESTTTTTAVSDNSNTTKTTSKTVKTSGTEQTSTAADQGPTVSYSVKVYTASDGLPSNRVQAVAQEKRTGDIWVGTDNGLVRFTPDRIISYNTNNGLISTNVTSITIDSIDRKYVGTGFGVTKIDGNDVISYSPSDGIGFGAVRDGVQDGAGMFWFATGNGLVELDEKCRATPRFTTFTDQDGIISDHRIRDYERYYILGGDIPSGGCNKALVFPTINGRIPTGGYSVDPNVPWIVFDEPLSPSDMVEACVHPGWRLVHDFNKNGRIAAATVETQTGTFPLYRRRLPAGTIILGGNFALGAENASTAQYCVFVAPLPGRTGQPATAINEPAGAEIKSSVAIGDSIYVDEIEKIIALPTELDDAQMIVFPVGDAVEIGDEYAEIVLSDDAIVYVAYDSRSTSLPNWLRDFDKVPSVTRITDMEVFTDGTDQEKLFLATAGTKGCVYDILHAPDVCDISDQIALDSTPPTGCAVISKVNSSTSFTLSLSATDEVTGVTDMQISPRSDFTEDGITATPFVPFQQNYVFQLPVGASATTGDVSTLPADVAPGGSLIPLPSTIQNNIFYDHKGMLLIGTKNPGRVYQFSKATGLTTLLFDTGEDEVLSMITFGDKLIVGTGTNGRAFIWDGTSLTQLPLSVGERVESVWVFSNKVYLGYSPGGEIYTFDTTGAMQLFKNTEETSVTSFATFAGQLYWTTGNEAIQEGDVLVSTTTKGHKHTITVPAGTTRLSQLNGTTTVSDGHSHSVINGVIQEADGHVHGLNGSRSGKVFRYDVATGQPIILHADSDSFMTAIAATASDQGILFAGSSPHGKILRFVPEEEIFIKSFQTPKTTVNRLKVINTLMYAVVDDDIYKFTGKRWEFVASIDGTAHDIFPEATGSSDILILRDQTVAATSAAPSRLNQKICAFVRFRDAAGNLSSITDASGNLIECYSPCLTLGASGGVTVPTGSTGVGGTGGGSGSGNDSGLTIGRSRLLEVDDNANVVFGLDGTEPFLSGNKIEEEVAIYYSEVFNGTNSFVQWVSIAWTAIVPTDTSVTIAVRSASSASAISDAVWSKEFTVPTANDITGLTGQFLQFRATLKALAPGVASPVLQLVDIQLRTSQATHYFTTNFSLPDELRRGILTYNGCINPPSTDIIFGVSGKDSTEFSDYFVIPTDKVFEVPAEHQTKNLRIGIKFISSPTEVPIVDEFAVLVSMANDAKIRLNLAGTPSSTSGQISTDSSTRTVITEKVQGHTHGVTYDSTITDKSNISGNTSINAGHRHSIINGVIQPAAGHTHDFSID